MGNPDKKILESPDPLGKGLIHSIYKTEINARARNRNSKDVNLTDRLSHDFALLRKVANELMTYNELLIRPARRTSNRSKHSSYCLPTFM